MKDIVDWNEFVRGFCKFFKMRLPDSFDTRFKCLKELVRDGKKFHRYFFGKKIYFLDRNEDLFFWKLFIEDLSDGPGEESMKRITMEKFSRMLQWFGPLEKGEEVLDR